jgi:proline iminopeptidase
MERHTLLTTVAGILSIALGGAVDAQPRTPMPTERSFGTITVGGTPHPYFTEGMGLSCIVTGLAPAYAPLFSDRAKRHIRFIYVDFKNTWGAETSGDVDTITLDTLVEEIDEVRRAFGLDKVCVIGHSSTGLLALEFALRHPDRMSHGILISVPPHWRDIPKAQAAFWEADASAERKAVKQKLDERLPTPTLLSLSPKDAFAMRYVRNGPRYFYDAAYDFSWAWVGRAFSAELLNRFLHVIAAGYDPRPKLATNAVPMFLVLGRYDYSVPYDLWNGVKDEIPHLTHYLFERSSHFPMLEESAAFDDRLIRWLEKPR